MSSETVITQPGRFTRIVDRVKRPLFLVFFILGMVGAVGAQPVLFLVGMLMFFLIIVVHLFMRQSTMPLIGHYLGMGRYLRVTRAGKIVLALTIIIGVTAINARINLLLIVLGMLLGVIIFSGVLSESSLRRLSVKLFVPSTAFAGTPFPARLSVTNGKKRLPSYSVRFEIHFEGLHGTVASRIYAVKLPPDRIVSLEHLLSMDTRGRRTVRRVRIATRFPFGFFEKWSYYSVEGEVLLFPKLGRIPGRIIPTSNEYRHQGSTKVLSKLGQDEFWGIREYRDGDNPQHIHWRSSARLGKRLVKEYHREESQNICILLDAHVPPEHPEFVERFERAVSFAGTLAKHLLDQDHQVAFAAYGQDLVKLTTDRGSRQMRRILTALAEIQPSSDRDFDALVNELDPRQTRDAFVVAVMLDEARERSARSRLQRHWNNQMRLVSVDSPTFRVLFQPPAGVRP